MKYKMTDIELVNKLSDILKNYTLVDSIITSDTKLVDDVGLNSLELMSISGDLEDEFNIEIPEKISSTFRTVGDVVNYLKKNIND